MIKKKNKGMNTIEILIVVAIIGIICAVTIPNLSFFHKKQEFKNTTEDIISLLNEARNNTISSKDSNVYGVHFESTKAVLFVGDSYVDGASSNKEILFDQSVRIPNVGGVNLNGGGKNVVFTRITGETINYGTILLVNIIGSSPYPTNLINISKIGIVDLN